MKSIPSFDMSTRSLTNNLKSQKDLAIFLSTVPLFCHLEREDIMKFAYYFRTFIGDKGERLVTQGEEGNKFYIVYEGVCEVRLKQESQPESVLSMLKSGDYFGQEAMIKDTTHNCSVVAKTDSVTALFITKKHFNDLFADKQVNVRFPYRKPVRDERKDLLVKLRRNSPRAFKPEPKTASQKQFLTESVMNNELFWWFKKYRI
eukprot:UN31091